MSRRRPCAAASQGSRSRRAAKRRGGRPVIVVMSRGPRASARLGERACEFAARSDSQLAVRVAEMHLDRLRRHVQGFERYRGSSARRRRDLRPVARSPSRHALLGGRSCAGGRPWRRSRPGPLPQAVARRKRPLAPAHAATVRGPRSASALAAVCLRARRAPSPARAAPASVRAGRTPPRAARSRLCAGWFRVHVASVRRFLAIPSRARSRVPRLPTRPPRPAGRAARAPAP